jgi:hypothetical protein
MDIAGFLTPTKEAKEKCDLTVDEMWKPVGTSTSESVEAPDASLGDLEDQVKFPFAHSD